jgi:hypothetical protein
VVLRAYEIRDMSAAVALLQGHLPLNPTGALDMPPPGGQVASMEAIKLLGTNGGSSYGSGGAQPLENPTGFTNMQDLLLD